MSNMKSKFKFNSYYIKKAAKTEYDETKDNIVLINSFKKEW